MKLGIIGLGKMGYPLALNLRDRGHSPVAYNRSRDKVDKIILEGVQGAFSIEELISKLEDRKIVWIMVPSGEAVDEMIRQLVPYLKADDIVIDGGNSFYGDTKRRHEELKKNGIIYLDVGTSGGVDGARNGACMMVGGEDEAVKLLEPLFMDICVKDGYAHVGKSGSGHYVKMVHNGIEYGMMQAIGEGFEVLSASEYDIDYAKVAKLWDNGSVIRGWLMELAVNVFDKHHDLEDIQGIVNASGEGLWTVEEALRLEVPVPVIASSVFARYRSKQIDTFSGKLLAGLRFQFGGHEMKTRSEENE
ncbi:MAG: decarboxylating 6-phosphogluconate dehydrogenase [Eubacteriaceae bacterium]|nr:decarboxylating 6-phosphogluconate dehydrogenase [Eubacteriaceae bacterium]